MRSFPDGSRKWLASVNGGTQPRWHSDGMELYYVEGTALKVVPVSTEPEFTLGQPQKLFESDDLIGSIPSPRYDVSADGQRFVTIASAAAREGGVAPTAVRIVENWHEEFSGREQN